MSDEVTHIRIKKTTLAKARKFTEGTRQTIFGFIDLAILEKIERETAASKRKKAIKKSS